MNEYKIKIEATVTLTDEDVKDILSAALEGGIGYWACLDNTTSAFENAPEDEPVETTAAKILLDCDSARPSTMKSIRFFDAEDEDDGEGWLLNLEKLLSGIKLWIQNGGDVYGAVDLKTGKIDTGEIDAEMADMIVQYALFGELVYG